MARGPCHTDAVKRWWHVPKFSLRSVDVSQRLDTFLVCAIAAVLGNRFFLILTGYPQLGNGTLHISHAIWGALMMAIAIIFAISYLPPFTRTFVAFLGGAGFGWFIDELGKFITRDVNYFFEPTIALIYITFIVMYLAFRSVASRSFRPDEAVLNAIESLKSASLGRLDDHHRREAIGLLDSTGANDQLAQDVRALLMDVPTLPPHDPSWFAVTADRLRTRYLAWTDTRSFVVVVDALLLLMAAVKILDAVLFALDGRGIHGFAEWCSVISSAVSGAADRDRSDPAPPFAHRCTAVVRTRAARRDPRDAGVHLPATPTRRAHRSGVDDRGVARGPLGDAGRARARQPRRRRGGRFGGPGPAGGFVD